MNNKLFQKELSIFEICNILEKKDKKQNLQQVRKTQIQHKYSFQKLYCIFLLKSLAKKLC